MKYRAKRNMSVFIKHYPRIVFSLGFVFITFSVNAQNSKIDSLKTEIDKSLAEGKKKKASENLRSLGVAYFEIGDYPSAKHHYEKALQISKEIGDERMQSRCLMNIGNIYLVQDNYPLALEFHNKSLAINEKRKDTVLLSLSLNNLGLLYSNLEKYEKALTLSQKAFEIQKKKGDKKRMAETLNALGVFNHKLKNYQQALQCFNEAYDIGLKIKNSYINGFSLNNIGYIYLELKDYGKSFKFYEKARLVNNQIAGKRGLAVSYFGLAHASFHLKKRKEALDYGLKSKTLLQELTMPKILRDLEKLLSEIYQELGNYKMAFSSHQQFKKLNDSIFNKKNIEKIAQLESEYKYKQALDSANIRELKLTKTVLTTSQDLAKSRQKYLWAIICILLVSFLLGGAFFFQKFQNIKAKNQTIVTEQRLLRSQMTPHFIFNSLSVLQGMILNKEEKKSITYLSKFSKLLRIILENSRDKLVPLIQELDALDNYMILQNMDVEPPYHYSLVVDENIDINLFSIPPMLIQPFIENAIEHAFPDNQTNREIEVHLSFQAKELCCTITDNGVGIETASNTSTPGKKSLSTAITTERLELLAKEFDVRGAVFIEDRAKNNEKGTKVTLTIPYKHYSAVA